MHRPSTHDSRAAMVASRPLTPVGKLLLVGAAVAVVLFAAWQFSARGAVTQNVATVSVPALQEGLVGYWTFNAGAIDLSQPAAEIRDLSGQGNHGNWLNHATTTAPGAIGQALEFDGVDDVVDIPDPGANSVLDVPGDFTISAWVYPRTLSETGAGRNPRIVQKGTTVLGGDAAGAYVLMIYTSAGTPYIARVALSIGGTVYVATGTSAFVPGEWRYVSVVREGTALRVFVDGVLEKTETIPAADVDQHDQVLKMGESDNTDGALDGRLDDVRIYNRALSAEEIAAQYRLGAATKMAVNQTLTTRPSLQDGLVGFWTMDGKDVDLSQPAAEVRDSSGQGNHGNWLNHATTTAPGAIGQALEFDGVDDVVDIPDPGANSVLDVPGDFTISAWVYPYDIPDAGIFPGQYPRIVQKGYSVAGDAAGAYVFSIDRKTSIRNDAYLSIAINIGGVVYQATSVSPVRPKEWVFATAVRKGTSLIVYANGQLERSITIPASNVAQHDEPLKLGESDNLGGALHGILDDVRIYNRALSAEEIMKLYRLGATSKINKTLTTRPSLQDGLVGFWTMDGKDVDLSQPAAEVRDVSPQGNHGNWLNHATTTAPGRVGQALEFDGYDDYVDAGSAASLDNLSNFTYAAWIRADGYVTDYMPIMGKGTVSVGPSVAKRFLVNSNNADCTGGDGSTDGCLEISINTSGTTRTVFTPAGTIRPGRWYHVAVTYANGTAPKVYVNGVESAYVSQSAGSGTDVDESAGPFLVGSWNHDGSLTPGGPAGWFDGKIDDVRVYNRALSAEEIMQLYRLGR